MIATIAVVLAVLGLLLRVWLVDHRPVNSDEAVVGLMAHDILHGHFVAFYWGQHYGGVEPYVTSMLFAIFGKSDTTLNMTPVVLFMVASVLVYFIARRFLPSTVALFAALAVWVGPPIVVLSSTGAGFRMSCLVLGLAAVLMATRIREGRIREGGGTSLSWALLGFFLGMGVWASVEILYFVAPCAVLVVPALRASGAASRIRHLVFGAVGAVIGGMPFLWVTVTSRFGTLTQPRGASYGGTPFDRAKVLANSAAPMALAARMPFTGSWVGGRPAGQVLYAVVALCVVGAIGLSLRTPEARRGVAFVAFIVAFPVIFSFLPPTIINIEGRYVIFLPLFLVLAALGAVWLLPTKALRTAVAAMLAVVMAGVTVAEVHAAVPAARLSRLTSAFSVDRRSVSGLASLLERRDLAVGFAGYWVAYALDFESGAHLRYTPVPWDTVRSPAYERATNAAARPAWIVCGQRSLAVCTAAVNSYAVNPFGITYESLTGWLRNARIPYSTDVASGFTVVIPSVRVLPAGTAARPGLRRG